MAKGVNKVILIGNLGNDPEIRFSNDGTAFANLSVATDESYKDKQTGQMVPKTEWHKVLFAGRTAEICRDYLHKGSKIFVEGKLQTRKWQDQSGQDRYSTEVKGFDLQMLDSKGDGQQTHAPQQARQQPAQYGQPPQQRPQQTPTGYDAAPMNQRQPNPRQQAPVSTDDWSDDIPF